VEAKNGLHEMRERVIAEVARDVADVELAGEGRARRRVDDGREPGLVERRVGDAKTRAVGDETSLACGGGEGEAVEGEYGLRKKREVSAE
jgi:hypothetical protein